MRRIFKYPLNTEGASTKIQGKIYRVLDIKSQRGVPTLWAEVDDNIDEVCLLVISIGTGWGVSNELDKWNYLGTEFEGDYVWHFYGKQIEIDNDEMEKSTYRALLSDKEIIWS